MGGNPAVVVRGAGTANNPFKVTITLDPSVSNLLSITNEGLLASLANGGIEADNTDCIEFTGTGSAEDPLTASPILDPAITNLLSCGTEGLLATLVGKPLWQPIPRTESFAAQHGQFVFMDSTAGIRNVTLPDATAMPGGQVGVKRVAGSNNVACAAGFSQTVDGVASVILASVNQAAVFVSDGSNWFRIGSV